MKNASGFTIYKLGLHLFKSRWEMINANFEREKSDFVQKTCNCNVQKNLLDVNFSFLFKNQFNIRQLYLNSNKQVLIHGGKITKIHYLDISMISALINLN